MVIDNMCFRFARAAVLSSAFLAIFAPLLIAVQRAPDARRALEHGERAEQIAAIESLEAKRELPAAWTAPLFAFVNAELVRQEQRLDCAEAADKIPFMGDEIALSQLQADPAQHRDSKRPLVGSVRVSSLYRGPAKDLAKSHFALEATPLDERGKRIGTARAYAYLPRSFGGLLLERLATAPSGKRETAIVRLEVSPLDAAPQHANLLVATDWQLLCDGAWTEWEFAGLRSAFRVIPKLGKAAVPGLVELLVREPTPKRPALTETLRAMCLGTLLNLDAGERRQAALLIERAVTKQQGADRDALIRAQATLRESLER